MTRTTETGYTVPLSKAMYRKCARCGHPFSRHWSGYDCMYRRRKLTSPDTRTGCNCYRFIERTPR